MYRTGQNSAYSMKSLNNFQNALPSDFKPYARSRTGILHFIESKQNFQNINKTSFHPLFQDKIHFLHNSGAVSTSTQPIQIMFSRYTAGCISNNK